ncbi:MAG TPA: sigma-70 family RNA polymerase sigma factor [Polyangia bacterium]
MSRPVPSAELERLVAAAEAAWPELPPPGEAFADALAERIRDEPDPAAALARLHSGDLYLAHACLHGVAPALAALDRKLAETPSFLVGLNASAGEVDEVRQLLRERLLVGPRPRLAGYSGRGTLGSWLRVAAMRALSNLRRDEASRQRIEGQADALAPVIDPELRYLKRQYADQFRESVSEAFSALSPQQRNLLRLKLVDGLNVTDIGALHGVHRATAARWVDEARRLVVDGTKARLRQRLQIAADELEGLLALVHSQLDVSLAGLLRTRQ